MGFNHTKAIGYQIIDIRVVGRTLEILTVICENTQQVYQLLVDRVELTVIKIITVITLASLLATTTPLNLPMASPFPINHNAPVQRLARLQTKKIQTEESKALSPQTLVEENLKELTPSVESSKVKVTKQLKSQKQTTLLAKEATSVKRAKRLRMKTLANLKKEFRENDKKEFTENIPDYPSSNSPIGVRIRVK